MPDALTYDETLALLRRSLVETHGNAIGFLRRSKHGLSKDNHALAPRSWQELATIEALLARDVEDCIRLELHEDPWGPLARIQTVIRGLSMGFGSDESTLRRLHAELTQDSVEEWRAGAPQLEASLWPFFASRTQHLANSIALALNEPSPYPALIWLPRERRFKTTTG